MVAKLPDSRVMGGAPNIGVNGLTPKLNVSNWSSGDAMVASGLDSLGRGISGFAASQQADNDKFETLKAESEWNVVKVEQSAKFSEDKKYEDLPDRYGTALQTERDRIEATITNPRAKEIFRLKTQDDIARGRVAAIGQAKSIEKDSQLGWLDRHQETAINGLVNNPDEVQRADGIKTHRALIHSYVGKGWLTHQQAFDRDKAFVNTYAAASAEARARAGQADQVISELEAAQLNSANRPAPQRPPQRLGELSAKYESKGDWGAGGKDNIGYAYGLYQFNSRGSLKNFLSDHPQIAQKFSGVDPESPAFAKRWREVHKELGPQFEEAQQQTFEKHARPSMERATSLGFKMDDRGVVESVLSGSVQHGKWETVLNRAAAAPGFSGMSAEDQVKTLYKARTDYVRGLDTLDEGTRAGVLSRYSSEIKDALGMVGQRIGEEEPVKVASADPNFVPTPTQKPTAEAAAATQDRRAPTIYDAMGALERERLLKHMIEVRDGQQRKKASDDIKVSTERKEEYERRMLDASVGKGALPAREEIEADNTLNSTHKNEALRQWGVYAKDTLAFKSAFDRFTKGEAFNPYDSDDRKNADRIFKSMDGNDAALTAVIQRTGILPESAAIKMRADLISNDPKRVAAAMTRASNALTINQNIMTGFDGASDLEKSAVKFRTLVDDFGMTAEEAANRMVREQTPEFKSSVNAKLKNENIDDLIKKKVTIDDLRGHFDESWFGLGRNPQAEFSVRSRDKMFDQFASLTKEHYLDMAAGDLDVAKKLAARDMKKTWGTSSVNGSSVVMQYPPERAPAYQGIPDAADRFAMHAIESIKAATGEDVSRSNLRITPIPSLTAQAYKAGGTPPYAVSWTDKSGAIQMLPPGKALMVEPNEMRTALSEERRVKFEQMRVAAEAKPAPGMVTGGEFGTEVQGGFAAPAPAPAVPQPARENLPGIGDIAIPGGVESPGPELPTVPGQGSQYRSYWQKMRDQQGGGFTGGAR